MMKRILIVEDDEALAKAMSVKLANNKFKIFVAKDGQAGLETALREKPDLILLDIFMPIMDGLAMLKKLRTDNWGQKVPVIMLTNLTEREKTAEALEYGVRDFLIKSDWKLEDIVKLINEKLK